MSGGRIIKGKLVMSLPIKTDGLLEDIWAWVPIYRSVGIDRFSWVRVLYCQEDGNVYYYYQPAEADTNPICPLDGLKWIEECRYGVPCSQCPEAKYFVLINRERIPVKRLPRRFLKGF